MEEGKSPAPFSKTEVVNFVRDMAEMEEREFALRKTAEELEKSKSLYCSSIDFYMENKQILKELSSRISKQQEDLTRFKQRHPDIEELQPIKPDVPKSLIKKYTAKNTKSLENYYEFANEYMETLKNKDDNTPTILIILFYIFVNPILIFLKYILPILGVVFGIILLLPVIGLPATYGLWVMSASIVYILVLILINRINKKREADNKSIKSFIEDYNKYNDQLSSIRTYKDLIDDINNSNEEYQNTKEANGEKFQMLFDIEQHKMGVLDKQKEKLLELADRIKIKKEKIYSIGIVPRDYRSLDAMLMINSIFENDQADTMREATLLYDERLFRGEVLRGIDNIYSMLGNLVCSMQAIENRLIEVRESVDKACVELRTISNQIYNIEQRELEHKERVYKILEKQVSLQEDILKQSESTRYAMESLNYSSQKYDWYMEQYRQRLL